MADETQPAQLWINGELVLQADQEAAKFLIPVLRNALFERQKDGLVTLLTKNHSNGFTTHTVPPSALVTAHYPEQAGEVARGETGKALLDRFKELLAEDDILFVPTNLDGSEDD